MSWLIIYIVTYCGVISDDPRYCGASERAEFERSARAVLLAQGPRCPDAIGQLPALIPAGCPVPVDIIGYIPDTLHAVTSARKRAELAQRELLATCRTDLGQARDNTTQARAAGQAGLRRCYATAEAQVAQARLDGQLQRPSGGEHLGRVLVYIGVAALGIVTGVIVGGVAF